MISGRSCEKCGHHRMIGPIFTSGAWGTGGEWLVYTCGACGYSSKERPLDHYSQKAKEPGVKPGSQDSSQPTNE